MSSIRCSIVVICLTIAACRGIPGVPRGTARSQVVRGVAYVIDTTVLTRSTYPSRPDAEAATYRAFQTFSARVVYARGRGRLDVLRVRPGPLVLADSAALTTPGAQPGDYYLFDSTGFVLVHPAVRTFSRATITHEAYGGYEDREGWPEFFEFQPPRLDTVTGAAALAIRAHGPLNIYWHTDAGRTGFARGRTAIDDAPLREMNVARWFGATRWLAHVADSGRALPADLTVTAGIPFRASSEKGVPRSFILKQAFSSPAVENVDLSFLVLPRGFTEVPWLEGVRDTTPRRPAPDGNVRWRSAPRGAR